MLGKGGGSDKDHEMLIGRGEGVDRANVKRIYPLARDKRLPGYSLKERTNSPGRELQRRKGGADHFSIHVSSFIIQGLPPPVDATEKGKMNRGAKKTI